MKNVKVYIALSLAMIFWGFSFVGSKFSLDIMHPIWLITIRLVISIVFLIILMASFKKLRIFKKKDAPFFILLAIFEPFIYFLAESYGIRLVSSTVSAVIIATIPIFVPLAGYLTYKQPIGISTYIGIILSVIGVSLIVTGPNMDLNSDPLGIILLFGAVFCAVGYTLLLFKLSTKYSPLEIITYENIIGIFLFIPFLFFNDAFRGDHTFSWDLALIIVLLGVFPSTLSYVFYTYGVQKIGMNRATIFTNAIPVVTAIVAFLWLGEELSMRKLLGIIIVIVAVSISQFKISKKK